MSSVRLAAACVFVLTCVSPAGAGDAPQNTRPFTRYKVLLDGILNDTLPFDVHFIIWGDVAQTAERVRLRVATVDSPADCNIGNRGTDLKEYVSTASAWTRTDFTDRGLAPPAADQPVSKQFEMVIEPLAPSRFYCFLFQVEPGRALTAPEQALLGRALLPAYQRFLSEQGVIEAVDASAMDDLRQALIAALLSASPFQGFTAEPGTVFDSNAPFDTVAAEFGDLAAEVFNQHNAVVLGAQRLDGVGPDGSALLSEDASGLDAWSKSAAFKKVAESPGLNERERGLLQRLIELGDDARENYLLGRPLDASDSLLRDLWDPDPGFAEPACPSVGQLAVRCNTLDARIKELEEVRAIVSRVGGAEAATLVPLIDDTIEDLRERKTDLFGVQQAINNRHEVMRKHARRLQGRIPLDLRATVTTIGNLATRRTWYASMDTGLAVAPRLDEVFPYVGANIYFRPVNREAPPGPFLSRFSSLVGFTWTSNLERPGVREALYGDSAMLVLGAGMRFTNLLRLNGGVLLLKGVNPNPLITDTRLEVTPFISLSGDLDIAGLLGGLFGTSARPPTIGAGSPPE